MDKKRRKGKKGDRGDGDKEPVLIGYALGVEFWLFFANFLKKT